MTSNEEFHIVRKKKRTPEYFKASGVLLYRYNKRQQIEILLGYDPIKRGFTIPGGKKEHLEKAEETAIREFQEETGNIFDINIIINLFLNKKIINHDKYILFAMSVDLEHQTSNTENLYINYMNSERFLSSPLEMKEMTYFKWILLSDVLQYKIQTTSLIRKLINTKTIRKLI